MQESTPGSLNTHNMREDSLSDDDESDQTYSESEGYEDLGASRVGARPAMVSSRGNLSQVATDEHHASVLASQQSQEMVPSQYQQFPNLQWAQLSSTWIDGQHHSQLQNSNRMADYGDMEPQFGANPSSTSALRWSTQQPPQHSVHSSFGVDASSGNQLAGGSLTDNQVTPPVTERRGGHFFGEMSAYDNTYQHQHPDYYPYSDSSGQFQALPNPPAPSNPGISSRATSSTAFANWPYGHQPQLQQLQQQPQQQPQSSHQPQQHQQPPGIQGNTPGSDASPQHYNYSAHSTLIRPQQGPSRNTILAQFNSQSLQHLTPQDRDAINQFPSLIGRPAIPPDALGQSIPPEVGQIPRKISTNLWEEEGTICLVVELRGMQVTRRCDNNMINGTKLLNSAQISRGRRDGVLKGERFRHVVKVGGMNFKGVWIPFERALEMAHRENVLDDLYPLFLADLTPILYSSQHYSRLRQQLAKGARRNPRFNEWINGIPSGLHRNGLGGEGGGGSGVGGLRQSEVGAPSISETAPGSHRPDVQGMFQLNTDGSYQQGATTHRNYQLNTSSTGGTAATTSSRSGYHRPSRSHTGASMPGSISHPNLTHYSQALRQARDARRHRRGASLDASGSFSPGTQLPAHMTSNIATSESSMSLSEAHNRAASSSGQRSGTLSSSQGIHSLGKESAERLDSSHEKQHHMSERRPPT